jgi:hypothetical protein
VYCEINVMKDAACTARRNARLHDCTLHILEELGSRSIWILIRVPGTSTVHSPPFNRTEHWPLAATGVLESVLLQIYDAVLVPVLVDS